MNISYLSIFFVFLYLFKVNTYAGIKTPISRYCLDRLSADEQSQFYSKIINIGASYGHGCASCTVDKKMREFNQETGDDSWVRRNFLVQFLKRNHWKRPKDFSYDFLSIVENDYRENFAKTFKERSLKKYPYRSRWAYDPLKDKVFEMSLKLENKILNDKNFRDNAQLVGGAYIRTKVKQRKNRPITGHLYQTYPGSYYKEGTRSKSIIDFSSDGANLETFFTIFTNKKIIKKLKKSKWRDPVLRSIVKSEITGKIIKLKPTMITAIDPLFWETLPRIINETTKEYPKNPFFRYLTKRAIKDSTLYTLKSEAYEERKFKDFFTILKTISNNKENKNPIPIFMANLIERPGKYIKKNRLEKMYGALIGNYFESLVGIDFTEKFIRWLKKIDYHDNDFVNDRPYSYEQFENLVISEFGRGPLELLNDHSVAAVSKKKIKKRLFKIIIKLFGTPKNLLTSLDKSFSFINKKIINFTKRQDHHVYLIKVDKFFENFNKYIHPKTLHPTVKGAKFMAKLLAEGPCKESALF